ncbi:MAG TPA: hypothetical protein VF867_13215 [Arthrobacter sp.]
MAVAETTCTADPTRDQMRRWFKHQWTCATCTGEIRWYTGLGWHHYARCGMDGVVFVEPAVVFAEPPLILAEATTTSMPPRRALFDLEQALAATASRPLLYLVPPLVEPAPTCANPQCPCSLHGPAKALPVRASILLAA